MKISEHVQFESERQTSMLSNVVEKPKRYLDLKPIIQVKDA